MKVVLITGSRALPESRRSEVERVLAGAEIVIEGACPTGADTYAREWAIRECVFVLTMHAQWGAYGPGAGPVRDEHMVKVAKSLGQCGHTVICHAWPLQGRGTRGTMKLCELWGVQCVEH